MKSNAMWAMALGLSLWIAAPSANGEPDERVKGLKLKQVKSKRGARKMGPQKMPGSEAAERGDDEARGKGKGHGKDKDKDHDKGKREAKADDGAEAGKAEAGGAEAKAEAEGKGKGKGRGHGKGDRAERAKAQREKAKAHLQSKTKGNVDAAVAAQQKRHAMRLAKLSRIRDLAVEKGDSQVVERVDSLVSKENARFDAWLEKMAKKEESK